MPLSRDDKARIRQFLDAAALLYISGLMSDAERARIHTQMLKWKARKEANPSPKRGRK